MAMGLSFGDGFFGATDELPPPSDRPTTVAQALVSMPDDEFAAMCRAVGIDPNSSEVVGELMDRIRETNCCDGPEIPVTVYVDSDCRHSVLVYDDPDD